MNNRFYLKFLNVKTLGFILFACGLGLVVWFTYLMIVMPFLKDIEQFVDFTIYKELAILYLILSNTFSLTDELTNLHNFFFRARFGIEKQLRT